VQETIKWSFPNFDYKGIMCGIAAFKQHCAFGFWKGNLIVDAKENKPVDAMGQFGRITSLADLPGDSILRRYVQEAVRLNQEGVKRPAKPRERKRKELVIPVELAGALKRNKKARATFDGFSYSHRKEYVEWIKEAKREETRQSRLQKTMLWLSQGKARDWKYEKC